jgi:hypothetical protein
VHVTLAQHRPNVKKQAREIEILNESKATLQPGGSPLELPLVKTHDALSEVREDEADRLADFLGDLSRLMGDGESFCELPDLAEAPDQIRPRRDRGQNWGAEVLTSKIALEQCHAHPAQLNCAAMITEDVVLLAEVSRRQNLAAEVAPFLRNRQRALACRDGALMIAAQPEARYRPGTQVTD